METGKTQIVEGVNSFKKALALVQDEAECDVSDKVNKWERSSTKFEGKTIQT